MSNFQSLLFTSAPTFEALRESSMDTAISLTPVCSTQSSYCSVIASSSFLQGLHQVAQKLIMMGFPLLEKVDVLIVLPSIVLTSAAGMALPGVWALAILTTPQIKRVMMLNFFFFYLKGMAYKSVD